MQAPPPGSQVPLLPLHRDQVGPISFKTPEAREARLLLWPKTHSSQGRVQTRPPELAPAFRGAAGLLALSDGRRQSTATGGHLGAQGEFVGLVPGRAWLPAPAPPGE